MSRSLATPTIFYWAKDTQFRFISCSENFARAAGMDSPQQIVGKTDFDVYWRDNADFYRTTDCLAIQGNLYLNQPELLCTVTKTLQMLVTKCPLFDDHGNCVGIAGCNIDTTDYCLIKKSGCFDAENKVFQLGDELGNEYLTKREVDILKGLLLGYTSKEIGRLFNLSYRTVEGYIEIIKRKLQCTSKNNIITTAIKSGLIYLILEDCFLSCLNNPPYLLR